MIDLDAETAATHMHEYALAVKQRFEANNDLISFYDKEIVDLYHMIEFSNFNASEGYKLVSKVRENRRRRRACKKENMILQPLYEFVTGGNGNLLNALGKIKKSAESLKQAASKQQYTPRTDLFAKAQFDVKGERVG